MPLYPVTPSATSANSSAGSTLAQPAAASSEPSFLDKAKQYLQMIKAANDASVRSGAGMIGGEANMRGEEAAEAAGIRRHLPNIVNKGLDAVGSVPVLGNMVQPFRDAGPQSANETADQTRTRVAKAANQDETNEINANPGSSAAGSILGTAGSMFAAPELKAPAVLGRLAQSASEIPVIGKALGPTITNVAKTAPDVAVNAAQEAGENTDANTSTAEAATRGGLAGAQSSLPGLAASASGGNPLVSGPIATGINWLEGLAGGKVSKVLHALTTGIGAARVDADTHQSDSTASDSSQNDSTTPDSTQNIDVNSLLQQLNVDPSTADGAQKTQSVKPVDFSNDSHDGDDGTPSSDVPSVTIVNGKKVLTTPSGQTVPLN